MSVLDFQGRAERREYWIAFFVVGFTISALTAWSDYTNDTGIIIINILFTLVLCWWQVATSVRRLRDANASMWWIFPLFVPLVCLIPLIAIGFWKSHDA
jgi:uncharacterized membrane protein YhaH (DUF805 family)